MLKAPLHVALTVTNLAQADWFYHQLLGLEKVERPLSFPGIWYQLGAFQVHLMVADGVLARPGGHPQWGRNPHLAFAVTDLAAIQATLEAANCPIQVSASGRAALFTQDPDGNIIELSQAP